MIEQWIVPGNPGEGRNHALVVEKDPLQGYLLKVSLLEAGWLVNLVETPPEALSHCEHDLFDAAIINAHYPGDVSGFALAEQLRLRYQIPSLMITSARYAELKNRPGFDATQELLFKPYRLFECGIRLESLLEESLCLV